MPILPSSPINPSLEQGFNPNVSRIARFDLSIAQVTTFFSTAITLLPNLPGFYYDIESAIFIRQGARYATASGTIFLDFFGVNAANLLTAAGNSVSLYIRERRTELNVTTPQPNGVQVAVTSANPTVDGSNPGSPVTLLVSYKIWPVTLTGFPNI